MTEEKAFKLYGIAEASALQVNRKTNDTLRIFLSDSRCDEGGDRKILVLVHIMISVF